MEKPEKTPRNIAAFRQPATPSFLPIAPGGLRVMHADKPAVLLIRSRRPARRERSFRHQCKHWWRKQSLQSAGRPEIPQDFRPAQFSSAMKRREADFHRNA
jgi:hypothetical protein